VASCTKREVEVAIESVREVLPPAPALTLAVGRPNLDKSMEFIVRHGTELGVSRFTIFHAARSQRPPKLNDKWDRLAVECCKQSGRLWLPEFQVAESLDAVLDAVEGLLVMASIEGPHEPLSMVKGADALTLLIGPEGDFTGEETALACARGAKLISLGPHILRTEVAAVVAATLVQYESGYLRPTPNA
jgi:16S rRNA (uracil1498-N3)-methyltransferase